MAEELLLRMEGICKSFHGVHALRGVELAVRRGEVHSLVGENGAGKSTLMRILGGAVPLDEGTITLRGRRQILRAPKDAEAAGVAMIHQELSLIPPMPVAENIFLGREPRTRLGFVDYAAMREHSEALLAELGTPCDVTQPAEAYSIATQQMVEVAKALGREADLIVMDEPTSALAEAEAERLFEVIRRLRDRGVSVVYISHKMEEIYAISDRITVLRDGEWIGTAPVDELPQERLIEWMVGRKIEQLFPKHAAEPGAELLRVEGLSVDAADGSGRRAVDGASLTLRAGEIVGLAGLRGSGCSELLGALFGRYGRVAAGAVAVGGRPASITRPAEAIASGIALLTNDRKATGLVLSMSVLHNATLASLSRAGPPGCVLRDRELALAQPFVDMLSVKTASVDAEVSALSGGNQQKVALAKWLMTEPSVLLLDEPTRGIDVGAKAEIYELMNALVAQGKGILLITSELPELLAMSDRILVMHRGRMTAELSRDEATQERIMAAAMEA